MPAFKKSLKNYNFWMDEVFFFSWKTSEVNSYQMKSYMYPDFHPAKHSTFHSPPEVDPWEPYDQHHTLGGTWSSCVISVFLLVCLGIEIRKIFFEFWVNDYFLILTCTEVPRFIISLVKLFLTFPFQSLHPLLVSKPVTNVVNISRIYQNLFCSIQKQIKVWMK